MGTCSESSHKLGTIVCTYCGVKILSVVGRGGESTSQDFENVVGYIGVYMWCQ